MRSIVLAALVATLLANFALAIEPRPYRTWILPDEEEAELRLVRVDGGTVELQHPTGESIIIAREKLGETDKQYIVDEVKLIWARIVLDPKILSPVNIQLIELFAGSASGAGEGPFAQGITPMQMGGQEGLTPGNLSEKFGVPESRTMDAGEEKGVVYIVYGPIAVGSKGDDDPVTWLRVDRKLAADGLKKRAQAALGIESTTPEPRRTTPTP